MISKQHENKIISLINKTTIKDKTSIVAIDGLTCSGKSTLASQIATKLQDVAIIMVDNFYRPLTAEESMSLNPELRYNQYFDWKRLLREVLGPLSKNSPTIYRRHDWYTNQPAEWHRVKPHRVIILEGVYSTRPELRSYFSVMVYVHTSKEIRLNRLLSRGYTDTSWMSHWTASEDWYVKHMKPAQTASIVVSGQ